MPLLTVFTPAYNRLHTLERTYRSLCRQTNKDFIWLIVDDGSTDNTRSRVQEWISEDVVTIRYVYQENQGMHGAHNTAYDNIDTYLNTCIDSDDYMPDDAVDYIIKFWEKYGSDKYAGFVGLDQTESGEILGTKFSEEAKEITMTDYYDHGGQGDKKLVYRTDIIRQYPKYPLFKGEKYVSLATKYFMIDQDYKLLTCNKPLVVVEYQTDGSSLNMYKQYVRNPQGFIYDRTLVLNHKPRLLKRFKYCIHFISSKLIAKEYNFLSSSPAPVCTFFMLPLGFALYCLIRYKVSNDSQMKI